MITSILSGTSQPIDARVVVSNGPHAAGPQPRHKGRDPASRRRPTATSEEARSGLTPPAHIHKGRDPAHIHVTRGEIRPHAAGLQPRHKGPVRQVCNTSNMQLYVRKRIATGPQRNRNKVKQNNSNNNKIKYPQLCAYRYGNSEMLLSVGFIKMPALFTLGLE